MVNDGRPKADVARAYRLAKKIRILWHKTDGTTHAWPGAIRAVVCRPAKVPFGLPTGAQSAPLE